MLTRIMRPGLKPFTIAVVGLAVLHRRCRRADQSQPPAGAVAPAWDKGIQPISRESYWNAIECGKQKGARPACVFYDADLCKNDDFALTFFTPYKYVAYNVWQAVSQKQPPPTPDYGAAQRTRITLGITPVVGSAIRSPR
jgi:hypothetical protein